MLVEQLLSHVLIRIEICKKPTCLLNKNKILIGCIILYYSKHMISESKVSGEGWQHLSQTPHILSAPVEAGGTAEFTRNPQNREDCHQFCAYKLCAKLKGIGL